MEFYLYQSMATLIFFHSGISRVEQFLDGDEVTSSTDFDGRPHVNLVAARQGQPALYYQIPP